MIRREKNEKDDPKAIASLSSFHLEADRHRTGLSLFVCGIIGISDFTEERIVLCSHGGRITVSGKRLSLCVYENGTVEITGRVTGMEFGYGKN